MKIEFINHPFVFTDAGTRHEISEIKGTPRVGAVLDDELLQVWKPDGGSAFYAL